MTSFMLEGFAVLNRFLVIVVWLGGVVLGTFGGVAAGQPCSSSNVLAEPFPGAGSGVELIGTLLEAPAVQGVPPFDQGDPLPLAGASFSVEFWVRRFESTGSAQFVFFHGSQSANRGVTLGFRADDRFTFAFWGNDLDTPDAYPADGLWHHWAGTYDASTNVRRIYRDTVLVAEDVSASDVLSFPFNGRFLLGGLASQDRMSGVIDQVRVWRKALTQAEIASVWKSEVDPFGSLAGSLETEYLFDEAIGSGESGPFPDTGFSFPVVNRVMEATLVGVPRRVEYACDCDANGQADNEEVGPAGEGFERALRLSPGDRLATGTASAASMLINRDFTVECWVFNGPRSSGGNVLLTMGREGFGRPFGISFTSTRLAGFGGSTGPIVFTNDSFPPDWQWHHWAFVYRSNGAQVQIFRDGQLRGAGQTLNYNGQGEITLGGFEDSPGFSGAIDELRVWRRALEIPEIRENLNLPIVSSVRPDLLFAHSFDSGDSEFFPKTFGGSQFSFSRVGGTTASEPFDLLADCDGNLSPDSCDIASGGEDDVNGNGVPDSCEPTVICPPDVNGDGALNGADFNAWLAAFGAGDAVADQNMDGLLNGADFNAWLFNFQVGCGE